MLTILVLEAPPQYVQHVPVSYRQEVSNCFLSCMQPYRYSRRLWAALLAEFIGMAIFQIYGGSANDEVAAFGNGLTLAVVSKYLSSTSCFSYVSLQRSIRISFTMLHRTTRFV